MGYPGFIAVWLGLKVVPQWKRWNENTKMAGKELEGRAVFNIFLIGNGLSVVFAGLGAKCIQWLDDGQWNIAIAVISVVASASIASCFLSRMFSRSK
jgi:hypothetical protein